MYMTTKRYICPGLVCLLIAACGQQTGPEPQASAAEPAAEARNMQLVGTHDLQGRSAYHAITHRIDERFVLFVGHHSGQADNPMTGVTEVNGLSVLDVTDPSAPQMLAHLPPTGLSANGTQHLQICDGAALPNGDPAMTYLVRTNGNESFEVWNISDPTAPVFLSTIAEMGESSRPASNRGTRETHKLHWDCATGIGFFNGTAEGWRVTRVLRAYDLSDPSTPRHIRDFGLVGWEPAATGEFPPPSISGLHQAFVFENRMYLGYGSGNEGTLQILDVDKFLSGIPGSANPMAPTPENLLYPQVSRLDMPSYWGVHTAKPVIGLAVPGYTDDGAIRDFLIVPSEAGPDSQLCQGVRDVVFLIDITEDDKPYPASSFEVPAELGDFCRRGGRFGPHSVHDELDPRFDKTLMLLSYFNAGVRAVDIRNPFQPVEVAYYVPRVNENTAEFCVSDGDTEICRRSVQTNNVNIDDRGYIYLVDRANTGLHIVELTGEARALVGL